MVLTKVENLGVKHSISVKNCPCASDGWKECSNCVSRLRSGEDYPVASQEFIHKPGASVSLHFKNIRSWKNIWQVPGAIHNRGKVSYCWIYLFYFFLIEYIWDLIGLISKPAMLLFSISPFINLFTCWRCGMAALMLCYHSLHNAPVKVTSVLVLFVIFRGLF